MDKLKVSTSLNLKGEIKISGSKNAALPILCASILSSDDLCLENVPNLQDIKTLVALLRGMGVAVDDSSLMQNKLILNARLLNNCLAPYELVRKMRASILVLGPLLARYKEAIVSLPGGCAIGARPVDQHIKGLEELGAEIHIEHGYIHAKANKLVGAKIVMDMVTVTGTENLMMAATLAEGTTILENCAREPEVTDLANCLVKMGANIEGIGSDTLVIKGVPTLHGANYSVMPDRIETGTYAVIAAITQSNLTLTNTRNNTLDAVIDKLLHAGAEVIANHNYLTINMDQRPQAIDIKTSPYPGLPTDMQAQFMALNTVASGHAKISETIFENRFMHVPELCRMGANIEVDGNTAWVNGVDKLNGANVMATDLRASASLVLAGLVADEETIINRIYHLDRGYEHLELKLSQVGAKVERIKEKIL